VGPTPFAGESNEFALALYGFLQQQPGNLIFSPFSIRTALVMAYAGAKGSTAAQMGAALRVSSETVHGSWAEILERLAAGGGGKYELTLANCLWSQDGAPLEAAFLDLITRRYGGVVNVVDFRHHAEEAGVTINRWVEEKTKGRIRNLIPSGSLNADTGLVVVNAVSFLGRWLLRFGAAATRDEPFRLSVSGTVSVPMMRLREQVRYLQADGYQAVDLDYEGGNLSMLVLLPNWKNGIHDLEQAASAGMLHDCASRMEFCEVQLYLPRFRFTWGTVELSKQLAALGMSMAFDRSRADFSGINGHEPPHEEALFVSAVLHQAYVEVDEQGTEAAAATAVAMELASPLIKRSPTPIPIFRADHPFLFAIRDRKSGTILFLGRVADPTR
jgi:serpin B